MTEEEFEKVVTASEEYADKVSPVTQIGNHFQHALNYQAARGYVDGYRSRDKEIEALRTYISELESRYNQLALGRWISVQEQTPMLECTCSDGKCSDPVILGDFHKPDEGEYNIGDLNENHCWHTTHGEVDFDGFTHWMPIQ